MLGELIMPILTNDRCLMIELRDGRRIFTLCENLMSLMEFAKTFNAQIYLVEGQNIEVFDLEELPVPICDGNYNYKGVCKKLKTVLPRETIFAANRPKKGSKPRQDSLTHARRINSFFYSPRHH